MLGTATLLMRVAVVFALLGGTLWLLRRHDAGRGARRGAPVEVLGGARVGKGASVALVRIGTSCYALGVTERGVNLLAETSDPRTADGTADLVEAPSDVTDATPSFMGALLDALSARMPER